MEAPSSSSALCSFSSSFNLFSAFSFSSEALSWSLLFFPAARTSDATCFSAASVARKSQCSETNSKTIWRKARGFDQSKVAVKEEDWDCEEWEGFCSSSLKSEIMAIGELREECLRC